jgi:hypothetical protein
MAVLAIAPTEGGPGTCLAPGQPSTQCGIKVTTTPREYRRFPPSRESMFHDRVALAWQRYGRVRWKMDPLLNDEE